MFENLLENRKKIQEFLNKHERIIRGLQGILFFRLPVQFAVIVLFVDFILLLLAKFGLGFYQVIVLGLLIQTLCKYFKTKSVSKIIFNFFFPESFPYGEKNESNRVRSADEIYDTIVRILSFLNQYFREKDTPWKQLVFYTSLFFLFILTGTFWFIFTVLNLFFILPGIFFHPQVFQSFKTAFKTVFSDAYVFIFE